MKRNLQSKIIYFKNHFKKISSHKAGNWIKNVSKFINIYLFLKSNLTDLQDFKSKYPQADYRAKC